MLKRPRLGADHSPPSSVEVNEWSKTSSSCQRLCVHPQWTPSRPPSFSRLCNFTPRVAPVCPHSCVPECVVDILYEAGPSPSVRLSVRSCLQSLDRLLGFRKVRFVSSLKNVVWGRSFMLSGGAISCCLGAQFHVVWGRNFMPAAVTLPLLYLTLKTLN